MLKRRAYLKRYTPLKRSPLKRKAYQVDEELEIAKTEVRIRSRGYCEARCSPQCTRYASDAHHKRMRSQGGQHTPENLIDICRTCHDWIHTHTGEAYERGLLIRSSATDLH